MSATINERAFLLLRRLVERMGEGRLVEFDDGLREAIASDGIADHELPDLLAWLIDKAFADRATDTSVRITSDGVQSIPWEARPRPDRRELTMQEKVAAQQALDDERLRVLEAVYDLSGGHTQAFIPMSAAFDKAGLDWAHGWAAYGYLAASTRGLLLGRSGHNVSITVGGVDAIEKTRRRKTAGAPPQATSQHVHFNAPIRGAVQIGGEGNVANVTNTSVGPSTALLGAIARLREPAAALPPAESKAALECIDKLHEHAAATDPDTASMKVWLKMLDVFGPTIAAHIPGILDAIANSGL